MKTKEEIEQLAKAQYSYSYGEDTSITDKKRDAFEEGYTQCQQDMADKKYTEEDMLKAFEYGKTIQPFDCFEDFINSLNKQD